MVGWSGLGEGVTFPLSRNRTLPKLPLPSTYHHHIIVAHLRKGHFEALFLFGPLTRIANTGRAFAMDVWACALSFTNLEKSTSKETKARPQAVSRVTDNRHRTVDILGGAILGFGSAICGYHLNYPTITAPVQRPPYPSLPLSTDRDPACPPTTRWSDRNLFGKCSDIGQEGTSVFLVLQI